jgi:hypothetical protein
VNEITDFHLFISFVDVFEDLVNVFATLLLNVLKDSNQLLDASFHFFRDLIVLVSEVYFFEYAEGNGVDKDDRTIYT